MSSSGQDLRIQYDWIVRPVLAADQACGLRQYGVCQPQTPHFGVQSDLRCSPKKRSYFCFYAALMTLAFYFGRLLKQEEGINRVGAGIL